MLPNAIIAGFVYFVYAKAFFPSPNNLNFTSELPREKNAGIDVQTRVHKLLGCYLYYQRAWRHGSILTDVTAREGWTSRALSLTEDKKITSSDWCFQGSGPGVARMVCREAHPRTVVFDARHTTWNQTTRHHHPALSQTRPRSGCVGLSATTTRSIGRFPREGYVRSRDTPEMARRKGRKHS